MTQSAFAQVCGLIGTTLSDGLYLLRKKNGMFFGSKASGVPNAIIMTVLLNCKMGGINLVEYRKEVLGRWPHFNIAILPLHFL